MTARRTFTTESYSVDTPHSIELRYVMPRVNFREIRDRFTHIDADFVSASFSLNPNEARVVVSFYPWWEHPKYREAVRQQKRWSLDQGIGAAKEVSVIAINPISCQLSNPGDMEDWAFHERHPLLLRFETYGQIYCNGDLDVERLVSALLDREGNEFTRDLLYRYLPQTEQTAPYSLGIFPRSIYIPLKEELQNAGVPIYAPGEPAEVATPILFELANGDYIIAEDFELEVPIFEHRDEWVTIYDDVDSNQ